MKAVTFIDCANKEKQMHRLIENTAGNSTFAIGGISCFAGSFVVTESAVLRMNICAEKPAHRKSAKRYQPF
jgi:hypothetical protein